ncbi:winged helix-turn-helix domain-containing protein [Nonomuraea sp. SYSU D8015]|uniref:winged helix-turn-helix domain-containing protein n=1 Tax=Nonomuraea sp. SYSU D8015 TaxID=2593644 RepID=UPI00166059D1|nr:winged helix-turn-helix domain-containing protein [Nonomuraea sp. SYSU D8015]
MGNQASQGSRPSQTYTEIADSMRRLILRGVLEPGQQLHSIKEMAEKNGVSVSTMKNALALLRNANLIHGHQGKGLYVSEVRRNAWDPEDAAIIVEALKDYSPVLVMDTPNESITFTVGDDELEISRPDAPEDWYYNITYHLPEGPFGVNVDLAMFNEEQDVIRYVRRILENGGLDVTPEERAQIVRNHHEADREVFGGIGYE